MKFKLAIELELTSSMGGCGGGWVVDSTKLWLNSTQI